MRKLILLFLLCLPFIAKADYNYADKVINGEARWQFLATLGSSSWSNAASSDDITGSGTSSNPYVITTARQLAWFLLNYNKNNTSYYALGNDIDMGDYYLPQNTNEFRGVFDGRGHTIRNVHSKVEDKSGDKWGGLFPYVDQGAQIKNVRLAKSFFKADGWLGAFIGEIHETTTHNVLTNCHADTVLLVTDNDNCGGLIGRVQYCRTRVMVQNCSFNGEIYSVSKDKDSFGGLVGYIYYSAITLQDCIVEKAIDLAPNNGRLQGGRYIGNLVGYMQYEKETGNSLDVQNCVLMSSGLSYNESRHIGILVGRISGDFSEAISNLNCYMPDKCELSKAVGEKNYASGGIRYFAQDNVMSGNHEKPSGMYDSFYYNRTSGRNSYSYDYGHKRLSCRLDNNENPYFGQVKKLIGSDLSLIESMKDEWGEPAVFDANTIFYAGSLTEVNLANELATKGLVYDKEPYTLTLDTKNANTYAFSVNQLSVPVLKDESLEQISNTAMRTVTLRWMSRTAEKGKYTVSDWGHYEIYRNGILINDTVQSRDYTVLAYQDSVPFVSEKELEYKVYWVDNPLGVSIDNAPSQSLTCETPEYVAAITATPIEAGKIELAMSIPSISDLNGGTAKFYRSLPGEDIKTLVGSTRYQYSKNVTTALTQVKINDTESLDQCLAYNYTAVMEDFPSGSKWSGRSILSDSAQTRPIVEDSLISFSALKGHFTDRVTLSWRVMRKSQELMYRVYRRLMSANNDEAWSEIYNTTSTGTSLTYTDQVQPGYIYEYKVTPYAPCGGTYNEDAPLKSLTDVGFASGLGTVMGRISYGTGTAVQGVEVSLIGDDTDASISQSYASLMSNGNLNYLSADIATMSEKWAGDWTIQMMVAPRGDGAQDVLVLPDGTLFTLADLNLPTSIFSHVVIRHTQAGGYEIGRVIDESETERSIEWNSEVSVSAAGYGNADLRLGGSGKNKGLDGYIDEFRIWSKCLTDSQILSNFNRFLSGGEDGLECYYTFDEACYNLVFDRSNPQGRWNDHHGTYVTLDTPEEYAAPLMPSTFIPETSQLAPRGVCDENGEYIISGIPYTGTGTTYNVVPAMGVHTFSPTSLRRLVSENSLVHSGVDFTDNSSFKLNIQAYYAYGNYPASGLNVNVDGVVQTQDGQALQTDSEGQATVSVPIGKHKVTLTASGHTMVAEGMACTINRIDTNGDVAYTVLGENGDGYYNFMADVPNTFTYYDKSMAKVVGRVVGGSIEADKDLADHQSINNIGQVTLTFEPQTSRSGVYFNYEGLGEGGISTGDISVASVCGDSINTPTIYKFRSAQIEVTTDSETGEYCAMLPPVPLKISAVRSKASNGLTSSDFELEKQVTAFTPVMNIMSWDSIKADTTGMNINKYEGDTIPYTRFYYHSKRSFTYYTEPKIVVSNPLVTNERDSLMLGYPEYVYCKIDPTTGEEKVDTLQLWQAPYDGTPSSYLTGYPIFYTGDQYRMNIWGFESYHNYDTGDDTRVPLSGVTFNVNNRLATKGYASLKTWQGSSGTYDYELLDSLAMSTNETLQAEGMVQYDFLAGFPNPMAPYTLGFSISFTHHGKDYAWPTSSTETQTYGIVMGGAPIPGSTFVTAGPQEVDFVVSDPPGSNSYAYIEQGSKLSRSRSGGDVVTVTTGYSYSTSGGMSTNIKSIGGLVITDVSTIEATSGVDASATISTTHSFDRSRKITYSFNDRYKTSTATNFFGARGDVYIGRSMNHLIGMANYVRFIPQPSMGGTYKGENFSYEIGKEIDQSIGDSIATTFAYTQHHIINEELPQLRTLRRNLVTSTISSIGEAPTSNKTDHYLYYVLASTKDETTMWEDGVHYVAVPPENLAEGKIAEDSVLVMSNWIQGWEQTIAKHEELKYYNFNEIGTTQYTYDAAANASRISAVNIPYGYIRNNSFSGGAEISHSQSVNDATSFSYKGGWTSNVTGTSVINYSGKVGGTTVKSSHKVKVPSAATNDYYGFGENEESTTTFGYVLSSNNRDNYYSTDVYLPAMKGEDGNPTYAGVPFIFRLRGGQSQCYWEEPENSHYFTVNGETVPLSDGTIAIQSPQILIVSETKRFDAPSGSKVSFDVQLSNTSTATVSNPPSFYLVCQPESNPNGLIVEVDGMPITNTPMIFYINPGVSVTQTLTVEQSKLDITDYDNVKLYFYADGQYTLGATDSCSVHFLPVSSPITVSMERTLVNAENTDRTLEIVLSDYDTTAKNFAGIRMQHQGQGETTWTTDYLYLNDSTLYVTAKGIDALPAADQWEKLSAGKTTYVWNMQNLSDGQYNFRAQCFTINGLDEITTNSDVYEITKNTSRPEAMSIEPSTGLWGLSDKISLTFNKDIKKDDLSSSNFYVQAVLNDAETKHNTGINLEGTGPAYITNKIGLIGSSSFTLGMWYKPTSGQDATLLSIPVDGNATFDVIYTSDRRIRVVNPMDDSGETILSQMQADDDDWMYMALVYDFSKDTYTIYTIYGTATTDQCKFLTDRAMHSDACMPAVIYFGAHNGQQDGHVVISDIVIYGEALTFESINSQKDQGKTGNESNLVAYWPLDECTGTLSRERVHERQMHLPSENVWYVDATNYALALKGNDPYEISASEAVLEKDQDYVIELWVRAAEKSVKPQYILQADNMALSLNSAGKLVLSDANLNQEICDWSYGGEWHHVAISWVYGGQCAVLIDGVRTKEVNASLVSPFIHDHLTIGADMVGAMDDIRVWQGRISDKVIANNMRMRMVGDEPSLIIYEPFEETVNAGGVNTVRATIPSDRIASSAPMQREAGLKQTISMNWVADERTIILTPDIDLQRINGTELTIMVKNVYDLYGNCMKDPVTWNATVSQSAVEWFYNPFETYFYDDGTERNIELTLYNASGTAQNWELTSIPSWLSVDETSGIISAMGIYDIAATVSASLSPNVYSGSLGVKADGLTDHLVMNIAILSNAPDWVVNTQKYSSTMSLTGYLYIDSYPSRNPKDIVAVFNGEECVGMAHPLYDQNSDQYYVFLTVYGNVEDNGKSLQLRVWESLTGMTYSTVSSTLDGKETALSFKSNSIIGTTTTPLLINAQPYVDQTLSLNKGWNWISLWVSSDDNQSATILKNALPVISDVKSQFDSSVQQDGGIFFGSLQRLNCKDMYMIYATEDATAVTSGRIVNPDTCKMTLHAATVDGTPTWTWLGYPLSFNTTPAQAFADLSPAVNDMVKNHDSFAVYDGSRWIGSLTALQPGYGYMYMSYAPQELTFYYPESALVSSSGVTYKAPAKKGKAPHWQCSYGGQMSSTMSVIARIEGFAADELAVVNGDEVVGVAQKGEDGYYFISIAGSLEAESLRIVAYDHITGQEYDTDCELEYSTNMVIGTLSEPLIIRLQP